jgi:glycosyltransferase involved in cell wall biosynthesis
MPLTGKTLGLILKNILTPSFANNVRAAILDQALFMNKNKMPAFGKHIAINAADLDHDRIDGTRIYIHNVLKKIGSLDQKDQFLIYHKGKFNPQLSFPIYKNYKVIKLQNTPYWTQTRFAWEINKTKPDVLWMPMHSLPYLRSKKTKTFVTVHDLAFKFFPQFFPKKDLRRLNHFTDYAVNNADGIIAISNSTKNDILKLYPKIKEEKIKVIYHGYDKDLFNTNVSKDQIEKITAKYHVPYAKYIVYVGALQPRKNLEVLIDAFESMNRDEAYKDIGLVIAGDFGWLYKDVVEKARNQKNVTVIGKFETKDLPALVSGATAFVLPSLYEGFGLPILEAMACGVPVIAADNSSLSELVGEGGLLFEACSSEKLAETLKKLLKDDKLKNDLRTKGLERANQFSWEKCAKETLDWLKS